MKSQRRKTILAAVTLMLGLAAAAQSVPSLINYQGRLTGQTGASLTAGTYTLQFRIWDSPTLAATNDLIWGQQQNVTVQSNGVFNVLLGSPGGSPIPGATPAVNNLAYAFQSSNVFLGLTVAVSNGVSLASPAEILPRQQLLSVPFAFMAATAATAATATNASVAASVVPGAITGVSLAQGAVQTANIAAGAVSWTNLAPRQAGASVGAGGVAVSQSCGNNVTANLAVTIATSGRPVFVGLMPDSSGSTAYVYASSPSQGAGFGWTASIARDSTAIGTLGVSMSAYYPWATDVAEEMPVTTIQTIDFPPAGSHTYSLRFAGSGLGGVNNCVLVAFEL
jgi:hypothetical protein